MAKTYSIAEAKNHLSRVVHEAEKEAPVELTRRGRPVAMVVAVEDYRKLRAPRRSPWEAIRDFRAQHDMAALDLDPDEIFAQVRDRSPGKDFSW
ncbi:MAG: type II toxin-antitoxin system Phd/YefM family antitoxin [Acidobacteria bacterium]|nr:MAG: type II toxin-antitoxin system Phd/YefM family antitoxin [Acidobacteriota bacterium]